MCTAMNNSLSVAPPLTEKSYRSIPSGILTAHTEYCEGWLCHSSGGRALTAKVRGPWFNPGWLLVFHSSLKIFPSLSSHAHVHVHVVHYKPWKEKGNRKKHCML